jgi:hypothetical protein
MLVLCGHGPGAGCEGAAVEAIDAARSIEGVKPLVLPAGFDGLPAVEQLLVVTDLERADRGLPGFAGLSARFDRIALAAAVQGTDPVGPPNVEWGSNVALGYPSVLEADYSWMYDDGPGSANTSCTTASSPACWAHRRNILGNYGRDPSLGAAVASSKPGGSRWPSMTQLFVAAPAGALAYKLPLANS